MNIGEKIKDLRVSKMMTQKELVGDFITRNMLSQIEKGTATPSLATLSYLASRLGVPVGYFVSDGDTNETFYKKYSSYPNIIRSYKSEEWAICRDLCSECLADNTDNELTYMLSVSCMNLGISYFNEGKLRNSLKMFEEALEYAGVTVFDMGGVLSCISAYNAVMTMISPTLSFEISDTKTSDYVCENDMCKYVLSINDASRVFSEKEWKNSGYFYALSAKTLMNNKNYNAALALFSHVCDDTTLPRPIIYLALDDYEKCCKETEDYKDAYEISQAKIQLFEKMLADI